MFSDRNPSANAAHPQNTPVQTRLIGPSAVISNSDSEKLFLSSLRIDPRCELGFAFLERNDAQKIIAHLGRTFAGLAQYLPPLEKSEPMIDRVIESIPGAGRVTFPVLRQFLRDHNNQAAALAAIKEEYEPRDKEKYVSIADVVAQLAPVFKLEKGLGQVLTDDSGRQFLREFAEQISQARQIFEKHFRNLENCAKTCANLAGSAARSGEGKSDRIEALRRSPLDQPYPLMRLFKSDFELAHLDFDASMAAWPAPFSALQNVFDCQLDSLEIVRNQLRMLDERVAVLKGQPAA